MKKIWILSNISSKMYGDSTRPYYLGKYLGDKFEIKQYCKVSKKNENVEYFNFFNKTIFSKPLSIIRASRKIIKEFKDKGFPDIIYAHQLLYGIIGVLLKKKHPNITLVSDFHTSAYFELREEPEKGIKHKIKLIIIPYLESKVIKYSDKIITVSKETKHLLIKDYNNVEEGKISIVKNATDITSVYKNSNFIRTNFDFKSKNRPFLAVFPNPRDGFISNDLALEFLIEIAEKIKKIEPIIEFVVLGGGKIPEKYPSNINFTGYVKNYNEWLNKADVCIATYPINAVCGGVRNKICDYLAVGKPIIATSESMRGFDDLVNNKHYYECNTSDLFVEKILSLINNPKMLKTMEKENILKSKEYSWENRANELSYEFYSVLNV